MDKSKLKREFIEKKFGELEQSLVENKEKEYENKTKASKYFDEPYMKLCFLITSVLPLLWAILAITHAKINEDFPTRYEILVLDWDRSFPMTEIALSDDVLYCNDGFERTKLARWSGLDMGCNCTATKDEAEKF